jgi:mRNA-degrading endonuclease RelE of RelBE toxin-antitoxin system
VQYEFKPGFDRSFKKLSGNRKRKAYEAIDTLMDYFDGLAGLPKGLGLRNWKDDYWEIRSTLKDRIIFKLTDHIVFLFTGSHDDITKFMREK